MRKKILVVADSVNIHMMASLVLGRHRYDLLSARDGREAVDKVRTEKPDLVVMDSATPRMSGFEACHALRQEEATRDVPVILVTPHGELESIQKGYESGCSDYLPKPIDGLELLAKVHGRLSH